MNAHDAVASFATFQEIVTQPRAWQSVLETVQQATETLREQLAGAEQGSVWTGCGSPYFLALSAAATFRAVVGAPAVAYPSSELALYTKTAQLPRNGQPLIAVSRSGATSEVLKAVATLGGRSTSLAITCVPDSPLAQTATLTLALPYAQEQSWAQTRSFTSMLLAAQAVIFALAGRTPGDAFGRLPEHGAALIEEQLELATELGSDTRLDHFVFLGGGPLYGLACEAMLKMKEMSLTTSEAFHVLEYRHGPMSMVNGRTLVVGFLSQAALPHEAAVLGEMRALGATTLAITPSELPHGTVDHQIVLPGGLTDLERGALYLPVPQLLACVRAVHKGLDPDRPANLVPFVTLDLDGAGSDE